MDSPDKTKRPFRKAAFDAKKKNEFFANDNNNNNKNNNNNNNNVNKVFNPLIPNEVNYKNEQEKCKDFLLNFKSFQYIDPTTNSYRDIDVNSNSNNEDEDEYDINNNNNSNGIRKKIPVQINKYKQMIDEISNRKRKILVIELDDIFRYKNDSEFVENIESNANTYIRLFTYALDELIKVQDLDINDPTIYEERNNTEIVLDLIANQRMNLLKQNTLKDPKVAKELDFPREILRRYELRFVPRRERSTPIPIRLIKSEHVGHLITMTGIVTRVTDVRPMVTVALYTCDSCDAEIFQEIKAREFLPIFFCKSKKCSEGKKGTLTLQTRGSVFKKFQEIRMQEIPDQVPIGHTPRSIKVFVRGELTRLATAGDIITLSGIFLPTPYTGQKAFKAGLLADTYLEALSIIPHKKTYDQLEVKEDMKMLIDQEVQDPDFYDKLAQSIAPEIFGHLDVKKALLLMMIGASSKKMKDGMNIRGDINICLMGDPGVAKSQLLKHISKIAPRGIYTSGKGSSGVGLTAAVIRDAVTGEFVLEGGSLVLADMGICCIDEFDKMEDSDRTAIHEVMEQQTISIAKAGITTTLNARTSILAAANPAFGRYNFKKSPDENFRLPHSLLSRFDLLFLIVDRPDEELDKLLSQHVTFVHQNARPPTEDMDFIPYKADFIRSFVCEARKFNPSVPKELTEHISSIYANIRIQESQSTQPLTYTTARSLLGILRLAQARARSKFHTEISESDIEEAIRLLYVSKQSIRIEKQKKERVDPISEIYRLVVDYMKSNNVTRMEISRLEDLIVQKGFKVDQFRKSMSESPGIHMGEVNITFV
ncbi:hypothetical protein CYY_006802 [Polysphondylium violaceum]|uniref:DNA replication licensing factor MCM7 n=1 Tax=Polysphondylium violaceum TaxID=133409 RepID=A0A8J4PPJ5_9MYCE|nr:hypothetical protein CYY_006802 [Polysphondylium violaceum]